MSETIETDVAIIGAGPVGPVRGVRTGPARHQMPSDRHPVRSPADNAPSFIRRSRSTTFPAFPMVSAQGLVDNLVKQIQPFNPDLPHGRDGRGGWRRSATPSARIPRHDRRGNRDRRPNACSSRPAAARSSPRSRRSPASRPMRANRVFYAVRKIEHFRGRRVLIVGGGDFALDWVLNLHPVAERITLIHRRDDFRAAPHSVNAMRELVADGKMDFVLGQVIGPEGRGRPALGADRAQGDRRDDRFRCDDLLPFFGLTMKLGPIADWGLNLHENLVPTDTEKFETIDPGHFRRRRHHHLSRQAEADPVRLPRGRAGRAEGPPLRLSREEAGLPVYDLLDQPAEEARGGVTPGYAVARCASRFETAS